MPLAPLRNRTITLTPETQIFQNNQTPVRLDTSLNFADKFLPKKGLGGYLSNKIVPNRSIVLAGVTDISVNHKAMVADENGLFTSYMQPWYIENIPITLSGQCYLGAYPLLSVSDRDLERVMKAFRGSLNDFTGLQGAAGNKERYLLEFGGYFPGARRFLGYFTEVSWKESVKTVNMLDYTIGFLGRNVDNAFIIKGKNSAASDKATQVPNANPGR